MRSILKSATLAVALLVGLNFYAQSKRNLDNYRQPDQRGVNVFEDPKDTISTFEGLNVRVGGSFALQFQSLDHSNFGTINQSDVLGQNNRYLSLVELGSNFNLATANLDLDVALADGVRMHLRTYLSSRHHPEPYVKGGYFQIDKLDFISEGLLSDFMKHATIRIGHMENNYGDAHFRRSDNAQAIYNPFVGNLIMDAFTTEVGAEFYYRMDSGLFGMVGFANGKLNQSTVKNDANGASFLAKLGYDNQINEDLRLRLTGSIYNTGSVASSYLYSADRAGGRYYHVMDYKYNVYDAENDVNSISSTDNFRSGRYNPNFGNKVTAVMINPFIKYRGLEFFGTIEMANGRRHSETERRDANQFAGELIYRFGKTENFYVGGRYNTVSAEERNGDDVDISRFNLGAGWFMTKNILLKAEYVNQEYDGYTGNTALNGGKFNGAMVEAVISF
ncbi:hypothetical protein [Aestuariibaculum sediminum]|uniref:Porin n=1 Tax=Aestuariibaculum sediminum TaxID=2770637 RepID=A0A8J6Q8N2_9FLAO|nr:hypothetical protein [Aestuariibaculum sediminum]MBD0833328.1 hypothetical protein [Aestuariibaculum sediminum]